MDKSQLKVYEIHDNPPTFVLDALNQEFEFLKEYNGHHRAGNYRNINVDDYLSFTVLMNDKEFVSFSGAHTAPHYPTGSVRIGSRYWIALKYRQPGLFKINSSKLYPSSEYLFPAQNTRIRDLGYDYSFWTREHPDRQWAFDQIVDIINRHANEQFEYHGLSDVYNLCRPIPSTGAVNMDEPCWQLVCVTPLNTTIDNINFSLPTLSLEEWSRHYGPL